MYAGGEIATMITTSLGGEEDRVLATAQQIVKSLSISKEARQSMLLIFSSFDYRLANITDIMNGEEDRHRFEAAEQVILRWNASTSVLDSPDDAAEYFSAVDDIIRCITQQTSNAKYGKNRNSYVMVDRAQNAIRLAMSRLQEELRSVLIRNTLQLFHQRIASLGDDVFVDLLVHPDEVVVELKEIVDRMVRSGYEKECLQVYSSVRCDALDECLVILRVEKLSTEEVQKVEWKSLDEKMKKWIQAVKVSVRVLLTGEKRLCDSVFGELDEFEEICFNETAKGCVMQLLNFGEAVAICKRSPEKLFRILDMYEALRDALPELQTMVSDEFVISEAKGVLRGLGEAAKGAFVEFENCLRNETSKKPVRTGDVHPLPRYVMNYLKSLMDYGDSMDSLLEISDEDLYLFQNNFGGDSSQLETISRFSPFRRRMLLLISELEYNLEKKSRLYEDIAMHYIFLMNNIYHLVQKVKDSDLGKVLGEDWIRKRRGQIRQYATGYLRASWSKALSFLKTEGSSCNASKMALKKRFKNFNACFKELCKTQKTWVVPDDQLRIELRISVSEKVIPAYCSFVERFRSQLEGSNGFKYKYTPEDLEDCLLRLFQGYTQPCRFSATISMFIYLKFLV